MLNKSLKKAINDKNYYKLKLILSVPTTNPSYDNDYCISQACYNGDLEAVKILLTHPKVIINTDDNLPFISAIQSGNLELIKFLLDKVDPSIPFNMPLFEASRYNNLEAVKLLLKSPFLSDIYDVKFRKGIPRGPILGIIRATSLQEIRSYIIHIILIKYYYFKECVKYVLPEDIVNYILECL